MIGSHKILVGLNHGVLGRSSPDHEKVIVFACLIDNCTFEIILPECIEEKVIEFRDYDECSKVHHDVGEITLI